MANGVIRGIFVDNDNNLRPEIHWSYSQNISKRQTTVTCTLKIYKKTSYGSTWNSSTACKMMMNGETLFKATKSLNCNNVSSGSYLTVGSFTKTITHNSSGRFEYSGTTGYMRLYGSIDFSSSNPGWGYVPSKSNTTSISIPDIPVNSTINSVSNNVYINGSNKVTANVTLGLASYTCKVTFALGSNSYTVTNSSTSSKSRSISYAVPKSWCSKITNSSSGKMTVTCKTYSGTTLIHTTSRTTTVLVPTDVVPTISSWGITPGNSYSVINNVKYWLKGLSTVKVTASGQGSYGSTISKIVISIPGQNNLTILGSSGYKTSLPLTVTDSNTIKATVYDSRGRSKSYSKTLEVTNYEKPTLLNIALQKVSLNAETNQYYPDEDSNTFKISFTPKIYKILNDLCTVKLSCADGSISFSTSSFNCTNNTLFTTYVTINNYNPNNKYLLNFVLTDNINNTYTFDYKLNPSAVIFSFNKSGKSIGIGIKSNFKDDTVGVEMSKNLFLGGNMQTDEEKNIYFYNSNSSTATYKHKCKVYGGNSNSDVAIGIYDVMNDIAVLRYYDANRLVRIPSSSFEVGGSEISITQNGSGFRSVDTNGNKVSLAHVGADNVSRFGFGSYYAQSALAYDNGSQYLGGAYSALRSMDKVYLCCADASPSSESAGKIEFCKNTDGTYVFRPTQHGTVRNGTPSYMWNVIYSVNGVQTSSDRTKKENIKYFDYGTNPDTVKETDLHLNDLLNFITRDYELTTYNYIGMNNQRLSGVAQDIICDNDGTDNVVGQLIVDCKEAVDNEAGLCIDQTQLLNVTIGAFQQFVKETNIKTQGLETKITEQDERIKKLEDLVLQLVNKEV
ncbi:MAG: DUF859 family phage minor structural protein [Terrisporobacter othiniensis]|nr:DUF859 family phage minor structural protein [Terrisporobacter othiniensis]